jgi:hypothetical protein
MSAKRPCVSESKVDADKRPRGVHAGDVEPHAAPVTSASSAAASDPDADLGDFSRGRDGVGGLSSVADEDGEALCAAIDVAAHVAPAVVDAGIVAGGFGSVDVVAAPGAGIDAGGRDTAVAAPLPLIPKLRPRVLCQGCRERIETFEYEFHLTVCSCDHAAAVKYLIAPIALTDYQGFLMSCFTRVDEQIRMH